MPKFDRKTDGEPDIIPLNQVEKQLVTAAVKLREQLLKRVDEVNQQCINYGIVAMTRMGIDPSHYEIDLKGLVLRKIKPPEKTIEEERKEEPKDGREVDVADS